MSHFSLQQKAVGLCDEKRSFVSISDLKGPVECPKPRRVGTIVNNPIRPLRWQMNHYAELADLKAGAELLDIILNEQHATGAAASPPPPFFCGSPPARVANPLIHDTQFVDEKLTPTPMSKSSILSPSEVSSPTASSLKGGCVKMKFGFKPAEVRVEGFDCLNRDRQNSRIPAMA